MQRQDSLDAQMRDVMKKAVEMGCYDAHDWLLRNYLRSQLWDVARQAIAESGQDHP